MAGDPLETEKTASQPQAPELLAPPDNAIIECGKRKVGNVTLQWQGKEDDAAYHAQLSEDMEFTVWIHDQKPVLGTEMEYPDLPPGNYFWRISSIDENHVEGPPSQVRKFVVQASQSDDVPAPEIDTTPPRLKLEKPSVHGRFVIVTGTTEKTASVWVNGQITVLDTNTGKFVYVASMTSDGIHSIHVLVRDAAGNPSRESLLVEIKE